MMPEPNNPSPHMIAMQAAAMERQNEIGAHGSRVIGRITHSRGVEVGEVGVLPDDS
jgi:hypothetical protein